MSVLDGKWSNDKVKHVINQKKIVDVEDMHAIFANLVERIETLETELAEIKARPTQRARRRGAGVGNNRTSQAAPRG